MDDLSTSVQPHIRAGERVLWSGRPDPSVVFAAGDVLLVPFSIVWCGFAVGWTVAAARRGQVLFVLWGLLFVLFGCYFVAGRFAYKHWRKRRTTYALTDQRALVIGRRSIVDSPVRGQPIETRRSRDGRHVNVTFGTPVARWGSRLPASYANSGLEFFGGPGAAGVAFYDVADPDPLLQALDQARAASDSRE